MLYRSLLFLLALSVVVNANTAFAQTASQPVRLTAIHGPRAVVQDSVANYRAATASSSARPIEYMWDFGNGIASEGVVVAHRFEIPGVHTITVTAANSGGRDTLRTAVVVTEPPPELPEAIRAERASAPGAAEHTTAPVQEASTSSSENLAARARRILYSNAPTQHASSGYTWVLASDLWRDRLASNAIDYILKGLRVEVWSDSTANGSPAYRLVAGHFSSEQEALAARPFLPKDVQNPILFDLSEQR